MIITTEFNLHNILLSLWLSVPRCPAMLHQPVPVTGDASREAWAAQKSLEERIFEEN